MNIVGIGLRLQIQVRPKVLFWALLLSLCSFTTPALAQGWEPARFDQMMRAAAQARERGNREEAERLCVATFRYVEASVTKALFDYAALLRTLGRPDADAAQARAERYREIKTRPVPPQGSSEFLGWSPANELKTFAALVGETGRDAEAKDIVALAAAAERVNRAHFVRLMDQQQGRDPRGNC
jgi:hypothetical protein